MLRSALLSCGAALVAPVSGAAVPPGALVSTAWGANELAFHAIADHGAVDGGGTQGHGFLSPAGAPWTLAMTTTEFDGGGSSPDLISVSVLARHVSAPHSGEAPGTLPLTLMVQTTGTYVPGPNQRSGTLTIHHSGTHEDTLTVTLDFEVAADGLSILGFDVDVVAGHGAAGASSPPPPVPTDVLITSALGSNVPLNPNGTNANVLSPQTIPTIGSFWQVTLDCTGADPNKFAILVLSAETPPQPLTTRWGDVVVSLTRTDSHYVVLPHASAPVVFRGSVPIEPALLGAAFYTQGLCGDRPKGYLSNGLAQMVGF